MEPVRGIAYSRWLYWLLTVYLVHAVVVMLLVRFRPQSTTAFRLVVHAVGHPLAGADFLVRDGAARAILSLLCVCDGGGGLSLGVMGDGGHGGGGGGAAVG